MESRSPDLAAVRTASQSVFEDRLKGRAPNSNWVPAILVSSFHTYDSAALERESSQWPGSNPHTYDRRRDRRHATNTWISLGYLPMDKSSRAFFFLTTEPIDAVGELGRGRPAQAVGDRTDPVETLRGV